MGAHPERTEPDPTVAAVLATASGPAGWNAPDSPAAGRPEIAALVVDCRRHRSAAGRRTGHRSDNRQRLDENTDCRRAVAPDARAEFDTAHADKDYAYTERRSGAANYRRTG